MGRLIRYCVVLLCGAVGVALAIAMAQAPRPAPLPEPRALEAPRAASAQPESCQRNVVVPPPSAASLTDVAERWPAPSATLPSTVPHRSNVAAQGIVVPVAAEVPVAPHSGQAASSTLRPLPAADTTHLTPLRSEAASTGMGLHAGRAPHAAAMRNAAGTPQAAGPADGTGLAPATTSLRIASGSVGPDRQGADPQRTDDPPARTGGLVPREPAMSHGEQVAENAAWDPAAAANRHHHAAASGGHLPGSDSSARSTGGHFYIARAAARQPGAATARVGEGDEFLNIYIKDKDVREALSLLAEQGGLNILPTRSVSGTISLSLSSVTIDEALQAILKTTGLVARYDGKFIYVGTPHDFDTHAQALDRVGTRIYRPNYVRAADLESIIAPLLTPGVGVIKATAPAAVGIAPDANGAGGDALASGEALLVQDFQSMLDRVDAIVREIDRKPPQVAIEAMILSVELSDKHSLGVDWQFLRNQGTIRFALGTPAPSLNEVALNEGGLKFAFLDSNLGVFLKALEEIGDTNVIATPRLLVLNKQRAEILIGAQLGYVNTTVTETSATQSVEFLEIGTQLRIRPFISGDGAIRMEIHPELSTGNVRVEQGITLPDKEVTSVTTNILVQDGSTVIIGGLVREDLVTTARQVPLVGNLPWVGALFRSKEEKTVRNEILVLVTPRIVCEPGLGNEGHTAACEFHRRQAVYADKMSPIGKRYLARRHFHLAQEAWAAGDARAALDHIEVAIHIDPMNRAAIDLRADIMAGRRIGSHTIPSASQLLPHEPMVVPDSGSPAAEPQPGSR